MITNDKFKQITALVIKNLEGGYYHPNMLKDGRVKDSRYSASGETMFGIDRKQGGTINTTPAGLKFWSLIDGANARNTWKWNYKGGDMAPILMDLTAQMMKPQFDSLLNTYATEATKKAIENDDRLLFNFIYAAWNGPGWFAKWTKDINKYLAAGSKSKNEILNFALNLRTNEGYNKGSAPNSLIKQGGEKIKSFINTLFTDVKTEAGTISNQAKENKGTTAIILLVVFIFVLYIVKQKFY